MSSDLVGRYRRAYPRIWRHPDFQKLTPAPRNIALYVLTGPQTNRIGLFHFSPATAAEDLLLGADTFREGLRNVCGTFGWVFDADSRVMYVPSWWRWNRPENLNVLRGNLKDLSEIPPCALIEAFAQNLAYVPADLHQTFIDTFRERMALRPPTQEQEQVPVTRSRAGAPASRKKAGFEKGATNGNGAESEVSPQVVKFARETILLTSPNNSIDELAEAFLNIYPSCSRQDAIAGLNVALSEHRRRVSA